MCFPNKALHDLFNENAYWGISSSVKLNRHPFSFVVVVVVVVVIVIVIFHAI